MRIDIVSDQPTRDPPLAVAAAGSLIQVEQVAACLRSLGHDVGCFVYDGDAGRLVGRLTDARPELVFNLTQSWICSRVAAILELTGTRYTGSGSLAIELTTDKGLTQDVLAARGVDVPGHWLVETPDCLEPLSPRYPAIVKLLRCDNSVGLGPESLVHDRAALVRQVARMWGEFREPLLLQEYVDGREISVSLLGNAGTERTLPIYEIGFDRFPPGAPRIRDYRAKWIAESEPYQLLDWICPAVLANEERIRHAAGRAARAVGARDYARVDMRVAADGACYVIEVNVNPDLQVGAGFTYAAESSGRTQTDLVREIVEVAMAAPTSARAEARL